ncbi:hypothetical protein SODALDRAFT_332504 [Sodiomyces alkalinus F11]|uniref:Uncharacterized protein n=1 Tax=Sodiomyces alkalinus (strain CBS 110278 / VKM F-3762 / F11) TaxID=1314773 RepID=A0A3N2PX18_SODAK|nr:hypothetical protein SODALDRAFT_332504 [Sodiomyces alkalinus F11]ROT39073.1 hypothetical protein SODALDRAFT_332504 [Sodiomyces alkalinus F11]
MQESLDLVLWLRVGSFCSTVRLSIFSFTLVVISRRRHNHVSTRTETFPSLTVYFSHPKALEIFWISDFPLPPFSPPV